MIDDHCDFTTARLITPGYCVLLDSGTPMDSRAAGDTDYREVEVAFLLCVYKKYMSIAVY
jgi:hypothetical protein